MFQYALSVLWGIQGLLTKGLLKNTLRYRLAGSRLKCDTHKPGKIRDS